MLWVGASFPREHLIITLLECGAGQSAARTLGSVLSLAENSLGKFVVFSDTAEAERMSHDPDRNERLVAKGCLLLPASCI